MIDQLRGETKFRFDHLDLNKERKKIPNDLMQENSSETNYGE